MGGSKRKKAKGEGANEITFDEREIKSHLITGQLKFPKLCGWKRNSGRTGMILSQVKFQLNPCEDGFVQPKAWPCLSLREPGEGFCLASSGSIPPGAPDNSLISLPQARQIRKCQEKERGEPGEGRAGTAGHGHSMPTRLQGRLRFKRFFFFTSISGLNVDFQLSAASTGTRLHPGPSHGCC